MTVVDRGYQQFLPALAYSSLRAYPDSHLLLATEGRWRRSVRNALRSVETMGTIHLVERSFDGYPRRCASDMAVRRFMFDHPLLDEYRYVYITDSDFLITSESPTLVEQHRAHMQRHGLCYSNMVRHTTELERLSGLHFVESRTYYEKMRPVLAEWRMKLREKRIAKNTNDEHMLYRMVAEAGLGFPPRGEAFRPDHGIHLGVFHHAMKHLDAYVRNSDTPEVHRERFRQYRCFRDDEAFQPARRLIRRELKRMEKALAAYGFAD